MNNAIATAPVDRGVVSTRWLAENLGAPWLRILDVRCSPPLSEDRRGLRLQELDDPPRFVELGPRAGWLRAGTWSRAVTAPEAFARSHIPGSASFDVGRRLFDDSGAIVWAPELAVAMSELGVGDEHTIVLVDDRRPTAALVAAWALRRYSHSDALVLDGGFSRWLSEGRPVTREVVKHPYASFTARTAS